MNDPITFPDQQRVQIPATTVAAIRASSAKYSAPLWDFRAERVLKLGSHQWIYPSSLATAYSLWAAQPAGIIATAWKLFNRGWLGAAEEYFYDHQRYPNHPRHLGQNVIPLVDEDNDSQQVGWVRVNQQTKADENFAVFVQFALLEMFEARAVPEEYA